MSNTLNRNMSMIYSVLHIMGLLLIFEACFMGACFFLSWGLYLFSDDAILASNELKAMQSFIIPTLLTLGVGMGLYFPHRKKQIIVDKRSGYGRCVYMVLFLFVWCPAFCFGWLHKLFYRCFLRNSLWIYHHRCFYNDRCGKSAI